MNGVLQRLVGRAVGETIGSLRPRVPSRFESGLPETGWQALHAEILAPIAPPSSPQPDCPRGQLMPSPMTRSAGVPPESVMPQSPTARDASAPWGAPPAAPGQAASETPAGVPPPVTAAVDTAAPQPLLPQAVPPGVTNTPQPPVEPPPPARQPAPRQACTAGAVPAPLLSPDLQPAALESREVAPPRNRPAVGTGAQPATAVAPEPEVVIHIGRLDIRADPLQPARAARAVEAPALQSLSDYLRDGRS